jgi:hypothetical protein
MAEVAAWVTKNRISQYVPSLRGYDDIFRLRVILHDFGLVWESAETDVERRVLVEAEPECFDKRWDAFLAAYVEHLCCHAGLEAPAWVEGDSRYLTSRWYAGIYPPQQRGSVIMATPAAFDVHGICIDQRELMVV